MMADDKKTENTEAENKTQQDYNKTLTRPCTAKNGEHSLENETPETEKQDSARVKQDFSKTSAGEQQET